MVNAEQLLPVIDAEMATTRRVLERVPDAQRDWRPHERSFTAGELATHIANIVAWLRVVVVDDHVDLAVPFEPPVAGDGAATLAVFDANVSAGRAEIAAASEDTLAEPWTLRTGDEIHLTMPRHAVVRVFVLQHIIHHRGQLTVYLRMLGMPVPHVYGPSADEAPF